ncbi:hypothetical protein BDF14DRAFT_1837789 [Spinellus fusiger]|nr:hypothetical protein BDF14DRAFT_1837789 [Spinellus fusiger]
MSQPIVLITGCTEGGIGYDLCKKFVKEGCNVFAGVRNVKSSGDLHQYGCTIVEIDVTDKSSIKDAVKKIIDHAGHIDVLVNNAGCPAVGALLDIEDESIERCIDTNVLGLLSMCRAVGFHMARRNKGTIVNIGSIVGYAGTPWAGIYSMSKAAVHSLTDVLRLELKPFGINVVLVAPGSVSSNIGTTGTSNIRIPNDSLYKSCTEHIYARANASQVSCISSSQFADYVVPRVLCESPSRYINYGTNSFILLCLYYVPAFVKDFLYTRRFGLNNL